MGTLPTPLVLLDDGTGTYPWDITKWVLSIDGYGISRGRDDWQGAVTAGQLDIVLNNSTGIFTPGFAGGFGLGPFGGGGFVDQKIRLKETVNGVLYTRFTGYVKAWPVTWDATVTTFAAVRLTAVDAQARAERRPLRPLVTEEIMIDNPTSLYTLSEPEGSTAAGDTSGRGKPPLVIAGSGTALAFGAGIGPNDGLPCVQFNGGTYLNSATPSVRVPAGTSFTLECFFTTTQTPATTAMMLSVDADASGYGPFSTFLGINSAGKLYAGLGFASAANVNDGLVHNAFFAVTSTGIGELFLDGVSQALGALIYTPPEYVGMTLAEGDNPGLITPFVGTIAHAAVYPSAVGATRPATHGLARNGFVGESGTARMSRLAGYASVPVGSLDTSLTNVSGSNDGDSAWGQIQAVAAAEMGVAFIDSNGALAFHNRNRVVSKSVPDLILSTEYVTPDIAPIVDDQQIVNYMEVTAEGTGGTSLSTSASSEVTHGRYPGSQSFMVLTDQEALDRGNWIVGNFAEPKPRFGTLTINLYKMPASLASMVLAALEVDCWLRVNNMALQTPGGVVADVIVQGWKETAAAEGWTIACNVVAESLYHAWILDDPVSSILDSTTVLYV